MHKLAPFLSTLFALSWSAACTDDDPSAGDGGIDLGDTGDDEPIDDQDAESDQDQPPAPLTPDVDPFVAQLDHAEMVHDPFGLSLIAYDADDQTIGTITLQQFDQQVFSFESEYADGYAIVVVLGDDLTQESTLPAPVLEHRSRRIVDVLANNLQEKGKLGCAVTVSMAIGLCAPLAAGQWWGVITCSGGVIKAWCECAPALGIDDGGVCDDL